MFFRRRSTNRGLTGGSYELTTSRHRLRLALLVVCAVMLGALVIGGVRYYVEHFASSSRVANLEQENSELRSALDKSRFELELERATRSELERQLVSLNERLRQAEAELAFMKAAGARPPAH